MQIRELTIDEIKITVSRQPEDEPFKGNCSAVDPETDRAEEEWIRSELRRGNKWAWCVVAVTGTWGDLEATDYLGCCSYESKEDFMAPGGYFDDMKLSVLEKLNHKLTQMFERVRPLIEVKNETA